MSEPPPSPAPTLFRDSLQSPYDLPSGYNSSNDDHFSDAREGRSDMGDHGYDTTPSPTIQMTPTIISVDTTSHGEMPDTEAFEKRSADITDEAETPKKRRSMNITIPGLLDGNYGAVNDDDDVESTPETPKSSIPINLVGRVDDTPTHWEVLETETFETGLADAQPGVVRAPSPIPIPTMVVQRIEGDEPYHGEVPGTEAYEKRSADAQPDIIVRWNEEEDRITRRVQSQRENIGEMVLGGGTAIVSPTSPVHERARSVSPSIGRSNDSPSSPTHGQTRSASPILGKLAVENKVEAITGDDKTVVVSGGFLDAPVSTASLSVDLDAAEHDITDTHALSPTFATGSESHSVLQRRKSSTASRKSKRSAPPSPSATSADFAGHKGDGDAAGDDDDFGDDDFDDFGEVVEGEEFDDFEGFGEGATDFEPTPVETLAAPPPPPAPVLPSIPVPVLDYKELDGTDAIRSAVAASLEIMFPTSNYPSKLVSVEDSCFLTERSLSLWNQLVAPPPLQPPNWKISRIRRLFLVSLGVPVDLDEILPAETKQKKLVLPSINNLRYSSDGDRPGRSSSQSRSSRPSSRARKAAADEKIKNGGIGPESLDIPSARIKCSTSDVALSGLTVEELEEHVKELEKITSTASEVLTYWLRKREGAIGDKETFETVIESLVGYARKKRQGN